MSSEGAGFTGVGECIIIIMNDDDTSSSYN